MQKYVEFPLLAPIRNLDTAEQRGNNCTSSGCDSALAKFDMRVWVLVTSFQPLRAHIFSRLYGRRCGSEYSSDLSTLADNYAHLTNYSVQKKQQFSLPAQAENEATSTSTAGGSVKIDSNSARKLRRVVSGYRARNASTGNLSATGRGETDTPAVPAAYGVACCASAKRLRVAESDLLMCKFIFV